MTLKLYMTLKFDKQVQCWSRFCSNINDLCYIIAQTQKRKGCWDSAVMAPKLNRKLQTM